MSAQCSERGCVRIADINDDAGRCTHHMMAARRRKGLCANCGGEREQQPVMNELTGRQLRRRGAPAWKWVCKSCGRQQSERPKSLTRD